MIEKNEVLLKYKSEWLHFSTPHLVVQTDQIDTVYTALREVENLVNANGWHAAGFISYEAAPAFDEALHVLSSENFPLLWFGLYPQPRRVQLIPPKGGPSSLNWQATTRRESYNTAIEKIKDAIADGMTYQVNYTMRLKTDFTEDAWEFFLRLAQNQNNHAAFVNTDRHILCSASPELFFELEGESITCRPMKGTARRGRTTIEDEQQMEWLRHSAKNRAENVMIVDMIRNDLGRIAEIGSVHVPELFKVEKYPTLFQMTSTIQAKTNASLLEIFKALFPSASISGAPKVSTMNIISKLESTPRRAYTGSIGFMAPNRKAQFNVAIRTAVIDPKSQTAEYGVGGGIVWDSNSTDEYGEAMLKAGVLGDSAREFSLLETVLWTPTEGYFLLDRHLERMADSALYFDFLFSGKKLNDFLKEMQEDFTAPQRLRILLEHSGKFAVEAKTIIPQNKVFKVKFAETPIDSSNAFFFHKTTKREIYPSERGFDDLLLYNEKGELTEFTIGNLVLKINGELFTPPISCGLLAGTFRAHLLETGQIKERIIHKNEMNICEEIHLINSVRKWVKVEI